MGIPAGYEKLATIGIAYKNDYDPAKEYKFLNAVYYSGSTYVSLKDNPAGPPVDDKVNWQYMAKGFVEGVMSAINAIDTGGVVGDAGETVNAQALINAISDRVMTKLVATNKIVTNFLATDPTTVAAGTTVKELMDKYTQLNGERNYSDVRECTILNSTVATKNFNYVYSYGDLVLIGISILGTIARMGLPFAQVPAEFVPARESYVFGTTLAEGSSIYVPSTCRITGTGKIYQMVTDSNIARATFCGVYTKK